MYNCDSSSTRPRTTSPGLGPTTDNEKEFIMAVEIQVRELQDALSDYSARVDKLGRYL